MFCFGYITSGNFDARLINLLSVLNAAHGEQCRVSPSVEMEHVKIS